MTIELRPFQERALADYRKKFSLGTSHLGIAPTAFGKSILMGVLAARMIPKTRHRFVILAHREALVRQNADKVRRAAPGLEVEVEIAEIWAIETADVISASIGSLKGDRLKRCAHDWRKDGRPIFLIIDEAHHSLAKTYLEAIEELKPDRLLGLTATPFRKDDGDGSSLRGIYPELAFNIPRGEMIDDRWLASPRHWRVETGSTLFGVNVRIGEYVEKDLAEALDTDGRNAMIVNAALDAKQELESMGMPSIKGVCFAINVAHCFALEAAFNKVGFQAKAIVGETPIHERREWDARLKTSVLDTIVISCGVLTEGWDVEEVNLGLFARPTRSPVLADQMLGRVLRHHPDKKAAVVIDFDDESSEGRVTIASTFKLPAGWDGIGECLRQDEVWFQQQLSSSSYSVRSALWKCKDRKEVCNILENKADAGPALLEDRGWLWWDLGPELRMVVDNSCLVIEQSDLGDYSLEHRAPGAVDQIGAFASVGEALSKGEAWVARNKPERSGFLRIKRDDDGRLASDKQKDVLKRWGLKFPHDLSVRTARIMMDEYIMESLREVERGRVSFGKYKGSEVSRLPTHYLEWVCSDEQASWMSKKAEYPLFIAELEARQ